ncbi:hypothetical protein, partial [Microbacterium sp. P5_E9]
SEPRRGAQASFVLRLVARHIECTFDVSYAEIERAAPQNPSFSTESAHSCRSADDDGAALSTTRTYTLLMSHALAGCDTITRSRSDLRHLF